MASVSVSADGFLRQVGGGSIVGGDTGARSGRGSTGGVAGKRQPVDEYIASLPARAAIIGGKTLETLTSLPPMPQPKGQDANGTRIGINNNNGIGINNNNGIGINTIGGTGVNTAGIGTLGGAGIGINKADVGIGIDKTGGLGGFDPLDTNTNSENTADESVEVKDVDETDGDEDEEANNADTGADKTGAELTPEEQSVVNELRNRDREVRAHEQAHISAGGAYIRGGASYQYERGPDNKSYAVGGEVGIDAAPERDDPEATITKMQAVRAAATAPADPSAQDRAVAASAARNESVARAELANKEQIE